MHAPDQRVAELTKRLTKKLVVRYDEGLWVGGKCELNQAASRQVPQVAPTNQVHYGCTTKLMSRLYKRNASSQGLQSTWS